MNSEESFNHWFVVPIRWLQAVPNNDGSFVALATVLFLYERYIVAILETKGVKADSKNRIAQISSDFGVDEKTAQIFWGVMRHGILHQGMPRQLEHGKRAFPDWIFHHNEVERPIEIIEINGKRLLSVQPWMVVNKVIALWTNNLHLLDQNQSFPWAQVFNFKIRVNEKTDGEFYLVTGSSSGLGLIGTE